jgi:putative hydrolase of the HAD superfamily
MAKEHPECADVGPSWSSVRVVLFDAVGTLIRPWPPAHEVYYRVGRAHGSRLSQLEVQQRFAHLLAASGGEADEDWSTDAAAERRRWRGLVRGVFADLPAAGQTIFPELWQHFASPQHWQVFPDVAPLWQRLQDRGFRLAIASNFDERLERLARELSPLSAADFIFYSARLGTRKPGVRFFASIQRQLAIPPESLLMVGDDWQADYLGARQAGWQAVWLDRSASVPDPVRVPSQVTSLDQLAERLLAE